MTNILGYYGLLLGTIWSHPHSPNHLKSHPTSTKDLLKTQWAVHSTCLGLLTSPVHGSSRHFYLA